MSQREMRLALAKPHQGSSWQTGRAAGVSGDGGFSSPLTQIAKRVPPCVVEQYVALTPPGQCCLPPPGKGRAVSREGLNEELGNKENELTFHLN